jgi:phosphate transport system substrate-binding protein
MKTTLAFGFRVSDFFSDLAFACRAVVGRRRAFRLFRSVLPVLPLALLLGGCSPKSDEPQPPPRDKVLIKGSNTVGEELAPRLAAEYKKEHAKVAIGIETKGSASGFWGLIAGACDIASASRGMIKDEQQQAQARGIELIDYLIGSYSVAVVVNAGNPVTGLTKEQVRDIFTGAVQNWKDVGGVDGPIHLCTRDPISGTYLGFRELAMEDRAYATNNTTRSTGYAEIAQAVGKDPQAIGYASIQLAAKPGVKAVAIGGVAATASSVNEGKYPFARALHLYTNKAKETADTHDFIQFVMSARGQAILDEMGFVPHK